MFDTQQCVTMACLLDVLIPKPGNVHRGADFDDMTMFDFAASAVAIAPHIAAAPSQPLGKTILDAVTATKSVTPANTNLGIILLLAPLAKVSEQENFRQGLGDVLTDTTPTDAAMVFEAIRIAGAGGLGDVDELDVNNETQPHDLLHSMELARDRDMIALQYATSFELLLNDLVPKLTSLVTKHGLQDGMIAAFVDFMFRFPDTLIARKRGHAVSVEAGERAGQVIRSGEVSSEIWHNSLADLDFWLRSDGNKRNPGTTADMVSAALFQCLRFGTLDMGKLRREFPL